MTYHDALDYLHSLVNFEQVHAPQAMQAVDLERMRRLCQQLGHPERQFRAILVGGTNGKGSICAMVYAILRAAGLRVGLYTSPHLVDVRERIRFRHTPIAAEDAEGEDWVSQRDFADAVWRVRSAVDALAHDRPGDPPTYFELVTAIAFLVFAKRQIEVAVLEVGLGGRLDATNVVEPAVSILGSVGLDHTDVLGRDVVSIAKEKVAIARAGRPLVVATQRSDVSESLHAWSAAHGYALIAYGNPIHAVIHAHGLEGLQLTIRGTRASYEQLTLPCVGRHQAMNAALAVAAVELLSERGVPHSAVRDGLARVRWPGRLEVMQQHPVVVLDGAHNPDAAQAVCRTLRELWPQTTIHLIMGCSADKALRDLAKVWAPVVSRVICTQSRHPRSADAARLAQYFTPPHGLPAPAVARARPGTAVVSGKSLSGQFSLPLRPHGRGFRGAGFTAAHRPISVINDSADAYTYALNTAAPDDLIVITGSLFLVGEVRRALHTSGRMARRRDRAKPALVSPPPS